MVQQVLINHIIHVDVFFLSGNSITNTVADYYFKKIRLIKFEKKQTIGA